MRSPAVDVALFPAWAPLNNAIVLDPDDTAPAEIASDLAALYDAAAVDTWALWLPTRTTNLDAPDEVCEVGELTRDTTTLVMQAVIPGGLRNQSNVERTSVQVAARATDEPVVRSRLEPPDPQPGLSAWVLFDGDLAIAGAWSFLQGDDCGIYAVGTVEQWRRRGRARALVEHVLADARDRGARTASLQSTRMGRPLYESLGFEAVGRYEEWVPR
jgi:GNAT superfamily N-acetyltransferase